MRKRHWLALGAMIAAGLAATSAYAQNDCRVNHTKVMSELTAPKSDLTMLVAHRGVHAIYKDTRYDKYQNVPENSLESLSAAGKECIEMIEVDIRLTQDGHAILSHDANWGRETNVGDQYVNVPAGGGELYNPWSGTGPNPAVSSWSRGSVQTGPTRLILRNSNNWTWSNPPWGVRESPPSLVDAINYMKTNKIEAVLAIDVKDPYAMEEVVQVVLANGFGGQSFIKAQGSWFPHPYDLVNFLQRVAPNNGIYNAKVMLIYNTSDIAPNNGFGPEAGENKVWNSVWEWVNTPAPYYIGYEVNLKKTDGILQATQRMYNGHVTRARAIFNPYREWISDTGVKGYFNSDGRCCSELSRYYFDGSPYGLMSDVADNRDQWDFINKEQSFTVVTTDNVLAFRGELQTLGRRNGVARIRD